MKRMLGVVAGLALAGAFVTSTAEAQSVGNARSVSFGLGGGLSMPVGDYSDAFKMGYHGQGSLQFHAGLPVALRADVIYQSLDGDGWDGSNRVVAGVLNALLPISAGGVVQPYATAGLGMYNVKMEVSFDDEEFGLINASASETKIGGNAGLGLRFNLSGLSTFVEGRYHHIATSETAMKMIPITVGVMLR